jgi:glycosyltransferase involved in cell wall biosynthesis
MREAGAPRVSVLLPVRNAASTIAEAISSISRQTLRELEVVVVDDGSTDRTPLILDGLARADPRLRILRQGPCGLVPALNTAARAARSQYLARMDADDVSHARRLALQLRRLERDHRLGAVGCLVRSFGNTPQSDGWSRYEQWLNSSRTPVAIGRDIYIESPLAHPSVVMRQAAFEAVGGYRDLDAPEDYDLWLRMARAGWQFAKVASVLLHWRDHASRLTRVDPRYRLEAFTRLKAHHLARGPLAETDRPLWIWGAGRYGRQLARALESEAVSAEAFVDIDPAKIGRQRRGHPVVNVAELARHPEAVVIAAVPVRGARALIRRRLNQMGRREGLDYWCCA